ncbi:unnamed protein product [Cladocopium goreaui]|uniref:Uncharacterized protein n=1 Tax=Cladocopium goreaui TaxID=2562237 RepID=A0A9P1BFE7_9DINO|nr:unnamed protein product [Cladocopium goreaui]
MGNYDEQGLKVQPQEAADVELPWDDARQLVEALVLSRVDTPDNAVKVLGQSWVPTWDGWKELRQCATERCCVAIAERLCDIAQQNTPYQSKTDTQALQTLASEGFMWRKALSHGVNNCLIDSLILCLSYEHILPHNLTADVTARRRVAAACRKHLIQEIGDEVAPGSNGLFPFLDAHRDGPKIVGSQLNALQRESQRSGSTPEKLSCSKDARFHLCRTCQASLEPEQLEGDEACDLQHHLAKAVSAEVHVYDSTTTDLSVPLDVYTIGRHDTLLVPVFRLYRYKNGRYAALLPANPAERPVFTSGDSQTAAQGSKQNDMSATCTVAPPTNSFGTIGCAAGIGNAARCKCKPTAQNRDERASSPCAPQSTAGRINNSTTIRNWFAARKRLRDNQVLVPKDIIKKRPDNSIVSIGRGGGTVKVRGGVLMATNVAELQLTRGAVSACCITEPVHVEGGASVVLELQRGDRWGLRKSLQDASFLRMPILYTCTMPRNESTGKVQKALVQELRKKEAQLEAQLRSEQRGREQSQVAWYWRMIKPVLLLILGLQPRSAWNLVQALLSSSKLWWILLALLGVGKESVLQLCLAAWTYGALAQAGACGQRSFVVLLPLLPALLRSLPGALVATALLTAVLLLGQETKKWQDLRQKVGRLRFSIALALLLRLPSKDASCLYSVGLLLLYAGNRRPPFGPGAVHQVSAYLCSLVESLRYMACFPVLFLLALPSMVQSELQKFAWSKLSANLSGFAKQAPAEVEPLLKRVSGGIYWKRIWVDFEAAQDAVDEDDPMGADLAPAVPCVASSPAQICAQQLARQAGVDFRSVDSLKIARLSVLLKKYMKPKGGLEALEFNDLREAAADEGSFLRLAEERLEVAQPEDAGANNSAGENRGTDRLMEFLTGGLRTHREGATNAPWDCQVDVLLRWQGAPLNEERLQRAVDLVIQQQPMLRACVPPDDSTDLLLGSRNSGFSTTVAASWSLLNELNFLEQWPKVRRAVAGAIYLCWPRTFIRSANAFKIPKLAKTTSKDSKNLADEVYGVMNESGWAWWRSDSSLNMCLIHLEKNSEVTSCVYCSVTHKYADGGAVAAFVTALSEAYAVLERGEMPSGEEHPVLSVQEQRLWRYLEGLPGREGQVDVYLFDIVNDMYNHKWGHSVGIDFTMKICDLVRAAGRRMACSEEIAWISCMSCAMLRLMPDEEMLKLMIVHNGRLGEAEGAVACVSNYVMLRIPCLERGNSPVADICSRVKYMVTHGHFSRPRSTEQAHARLNIGGMIGTDGNFVQLFKTGRGRDPSWSRAPYVIQLRMDNEGGIWCVKDFKCHEFLDPTTFWRAAVAAAQEIAEGNFTTPVAPVAA